MNNKFTYGISGTGVAPSYNQNSSTISLACTAGIGHVINESKCRFLYQPGKSLFIFNCVIFLKIDWTDKKYF